MANSLRFKPAFFMLGLAALFFVPPQDGGAQYGTREDQQTFDYNPDAAETPKLPEKMLSVNYSDAELVNDPVQGVYMISKSRWKSWVFRAFSIMILDIALMVILLSLPKTEEHNIIISYVLSGISAVLSFWVLLCAWMLLMLHASAWLMIFPLSLVMGAAAHLALMKIKRSDISLSELQESFKRMSAMAQEDQRLVSIDGEPGSWPETDFLK
jgi:hypothetical protein